MNERLATLEARLTGHEAIQDRLSTALDRITQTQERLAKNLQRLTVMEERDKVRKESMERLFMTIEKLDKRLELIEVQLPTLNLARKCVFGAVVWAVSVSALYGVHLLTGWSP